MKALKTVMTLALASTALLLAPMTFAADDKPDAQLALAKNAIDQAQKDGATDAATLEMQSARDKYQQAQMLIAKEHRRDYPQAKRLAEESKLDADLADAKAAAAKAQESLREVQNGNRALEHEVQRDSAARDPS
jgi:Domain of unknown function (DUF4398)